MKKLLERFTDRLWLTAGLSLLSAQFFATLTKWNLWHDESYSAMLISYPYGDIVRRTALDVHPPLYYLLLKGWAGMFGASEASLRLFSALLMVAAVAAAFYLLKRLFGSKAARWGLAAMVIGPYLVRYGIEARMYSLAALLMVLATHLLISIKIQKPTKWWYRPLYAALIAAALYTHYLTALILPAHALYLLALAGIRSHGLEGGAVTRLKALAKTLGWPWFATWAGAFLLYLPWVPKMLAQRKDIQGAFWIPEFDLSTLPNAFTDLMLFRESWAAQGWWAVLGLILMAVLGVGFMRWFKAGGDIPAKILVVSFILVPTILMVLLSLPPQQPIFYQRYLCLFGPLFYGLIGMLAYQLWQDRQPKRGKAYLLTALIFVSLLSGTLRAQDIGTSYKRSHRYTMQELMATIHENYRPGDAIVVKDILIYFDAWYYNPTDTAVRMYSPKGFNGGGNTSLVYDRPDLLVARFEDLRPESKRVWVIANDQDQNSDLPTVWDRFGPSDQRGYAKVQLYHLP